MPITGLGCVKKVVTELGVFNINENGFEMIEIAPGVTVDEVKAKTQGRLVISDQLKTIEI